MFSENFKKTSKLIFDLTYTDPIRALKEWKEFASSLYGENLIFFFSQSGILIDIGCELHDPNLIQEGINNLINVKSKYPKMWSSVCEYNLANGYISLYKMSSEGISHKNFNPNSDLFLNAKRCYLEFFNSPNMKKDKHSYLWCLVNYGNLLSSVGRLLDAIEFYDRALSVHPDFPMALGNLAIEVKYISSIDFNPQYLFESKRLLKLTLDDNKLEKHGHGHLRQYFNKELLEIDKWIIDIFSKCDYCTKRIKTDEKISKRVIDFFVNNNLFLNLNLKYCRPSYLNRDYSNMSVTTNSEVPPMHIFQAINDVVESYSSIRYLLYLCKMKKSYFREFNNFTDYWETMDTSIYGIGGGLRKIIFSCAYNILDKVALLVNRYEGTIEEERKFDFSKLSTSPKYLDLLLEKKNPFLFALYDMSRDLNKNGCDYDLKFTRHLITHRFLSIKLTDMEPIRNEIYNINEKEFDNKLIKIMNYAKRAILYSLYLIRLEEKLRNRNMKMDYIKMPVIKSISEDVLMDKNNLMIF